MVNENKIRILYVQPGKYPEERFVANEVHPLQRLVGGYGLFSFQRSTKGFVENVPSPIADFGPLLQGVFEKPQKYFLIFLIAAVMLREIA